MKKFTLLLIVMLSGVLHLSANQIYAKGLDGVKGGSISYNPPINLHATCLNDNDVKLTWEPPEDPGIWLQWCGNQNYGGIGLTDGGTFMIAARWNQADLAPHGDRPLKKVAFIPRSTLNAVFTLKIFKGNNASTLLVEIPLSNLFQDMWNVIVLPNPVLIDPDAELWVGFMITQVAGDMPAGVDGGPAVAGNGDMVSLDGTTWAPLSSYGLDYNWNIKAFVAEELDLTMNLAQPIVDLSGGFFGNASSELVRGNLPPAKCIWSDPLNIPESYKVYRDNNLIATEITGLSYVDFVFPLNFYKYYITAVYPGGIESIPSNEYSISCGSSGQAAIQFNPTIIAETHPEQNTVTTQTLMVTNVGTAPLYFEIPVPDSELNKKRQPHFQNDTNSDLNPTDISDYSKSEWLSFTPNVGTLFPAQTMPVELTFNSNNLAAGIYNTTLEIVSNAPGTPHTIPVTLTVEAAGPVFHADKNHVITYHPYPNLITVEVLTISNPGTEPLIWDIDIEYPDSLTESDNSNSKINYADNARGLCVNNLYSQGCSIGDQLTAWSLSNINVPDIPCIGTPPWYQDYTDLIHNFETGQAYLLTVMAGYSDTFFDVWIDFNGDEQLAASEIIINDAVCLVSGTAYNFCFTIPTYIGAGTFLMRVRTNWDAPVTDPCATYQYGQAIDFKAHINGNVTPDWLSALPMSGTINPGGSTPIDVIFNTTNGMPGAVYTANLKFTTNAPGTPHNISASIIPCFPPGSFTVTPDHLQETHFVPPSQVSNQYLTITNTSENPFQWIVAINPSTAGEAGLKVKSPNAMRNSAILTGCPNNETHIQGSNIYKQEPMTTDINTAGKNFPDENWLGLYPNSGYLGAFQSAVIEVTFNSQGLPAGTHHKTLYFSSTVSAWAFVDVELEVDECTLPPPTSLIANFISINPTHVVLNWLEPVMNFSTIRWDNGSNSDGIGLTAGGTFSAAARWTPEQLTQFDGMVLKSVDFFPRSTSADYVIKVWQGEGGLIQLVEQPIVVTAVDWTSVTLDTPVEIDVSQPLYIGYTTTHEAGEFPAGCDSGPAVANYGDLISLNQGAWVSMAVQYSLNFNWNIAGNLEESAFGAPLAQTLTIKSAGFAASGIPAKGNLQPAANPVWTDHSRVLEGYTIKRNGVVIAQTGLMTTYTDINLPPVYPIYQVGARYTECTSWTGFVSPPPYAIPENSGTNDLIRIFPNPASDLMIIEANEIRQIKILNSTGKIVFQGSYNSNLAQISTVNFSKGIYLVNVITENDNTIEKLIIR